MESQRTGSRVWVGFGVLVVVLGLASTSGLAGAAPAGPDQGVTDTAVKIGFITSKTGVAASTSGSSDVGCKARIGRQNAAGGVNGRKLEVEYVDDASSAANLTQAQSLVQNDHVYMVINDSAFAFLVVPLVARPRRPADRWRVRRQLLRLPGQREGDLGVRQLAARSRGSRRRSRRRS